MSALSRKLYRVRGFSLTDQVAMVDAAISHLYFSLAEELICLDDYQCKKDKIFSELPGMSGGLPATRPGFQPLLIEEDTNFHVASYFISSIGFDYMREFYIHCYGTSNHESVFTQQVGPQVAVVRKIM
jgi:hypothetical protein